MQQKKYIQLTSEVLNLRGKSLENRIREYLQKNDKVICKGLGRRPVFISDYLFYTDSRNSPDINHRKRCFFAAIELIKKVSSENLTNEKKIGGKHSYEFKGITPKKNLVGVHILEFRDKKDKKLKLMSTFWDNKKT